MRRHSTDVNDSLSSQKHKLSKQLSMQEGSKAQESKSEFKDLKINSEDSVQDFQDLESVLNSFEIDDSKKKKPKLRRNTLASSMKFWRTRIDFT